MRKFFYLFLLVIASIPSFAGKSIKFHSLNVFGVRGNVEFLDHDKKWVPVFEGEKLSDHTSIRLTGDNSYISLYTDQVLFEIDSVGLYKFRDLKKIAASKKNLVNINKEINVNAVSLIINQLNILPKFSSFKFAIVPLLMNAHEIDKHPLFSPKEGFKVYWNYNGDKSNIKDDIYLEIKCIEEEVIYATRLNSCSDSYCYIDLTGRKLYIDMHFVSIVDKSDDKNIQLSPTYFISIDDGEEAKLILDQVNRLLKSESLAAKMYGIIYAIENRMYSKAYETYLSLDKSIYSYHGYRNILQDLKRIFP